MLGSILPGRVLNNLFCALCKCAGARFAACWCKPLSASWSGAIEDLLATICGVDPNARPTALENSRAPGACGKMKLKSSM